MMPFTQDWFSHNIEIWEKFLDPYRYQEAHFLEIGCFEGQATMWLLGNILLHPASTMTVIDTFQGSPEFTMLGVDCENLLQRFWENTASEQERIFIHHGQSWQQLIYLIHGPRDCDDPCWPDHKPNRFDMIYIDGSHAAADVLNDGVFSWPLLKENGILIFDDYQLKISHIEELNPELGIRCFLRCYNGLFEQLHAGWQVLIRKLPIAHP